jgi:D-glycero-D-manno-heptose 1,7-bisphosphate phosphatase
MKLVILDRDGVINFDSDHYIKSTDEWRPIPGSIEAIARLTQTGHHVVVATNQSGVGRGLFDMATLNAMHAKMHRLVSQCGGRIDAVFYCPDTDLSQSLCRKPMPGMFHAIAERFNTPLNGVPAIGDALRDLQAAHSAGAKPMLVLTGKGEKTRAAGGLPPGTTEHADLAAAVDVLLC